MVLEGINDRGGEMFAINGRFNQTFREFDTYKRLGIVSLTTSRHKESVKQLKRGDEFALYSTRQGFLGIGRVVEPAVPFEAFKMHSGGKLIEYDEYPFKEIQRINPHFGKEEYVLRVEWVTVVESDDDGLMIGEYEAADPVTQLDADMTQRVRNAFDLK